MRPVRQRDVPADRVDRVHASHQLPGRRLQGEQERRQAAPPDQGIQVRQVPGRANQNRSSQNHPLLEMSKEMHGRNIYNIMDI